MPFSFKIKYWFTINHKDNFEHIIFQITTAFDPDSPFMIPTINFKFFTPKSTASDSKNPNHLFLDFDELYELREPDFFKAAHPKIGVRVNKSVGNKLESISQQDRLG